MGKKEYTKQEYKYSRIYDTFVSRYAVSTLDSFVRYLRRHLTNGKQ